MSKRGAVCPTAQREDPIEAAVLAVQSQEAVSRDAAGQVGVELSFDETRHRAPAALGGLKEAPEILAHRLVQSRGFDAPRKRERGVRPLPAASLSLRDHAVRRARAVPVWSARAGIARWAAVAEQQGGIGGGGSTSTRAPKRAAIETSVR